VPDAGVFYKAVVTRQDGIALGTFWTSSGLEADSSPGRYLPSVGFEVRSDEANTLG
jgi:hypothetical protein